MTYNPNIPDSDDFQDESQEQIKDNFTVNDNTLAIEHYEPSDATANRGKHRKVIMPDNGSHISTAADEPAFYNYKINGNVGALQFSRGPSDAVPTPVTYIQSHSSGQSINQNATLNVLDFTGLGKTIGTLQGVDFLNFSTMSSSRIHADVFWNGTNFRITLLYNASQINVTSSGNVLQFINGPINNYTDFHYVLNLKRVQ